MKTTPRVGGRPLTRSSPKIVCSTSPAASTVAATLAQGKLEGYEVQCPWHGSRFDIRTGRVAGPPAMRPEPTYEIKLEDDNILLVKNRAKQDQS
jgi:nitrite reductase/ring-hydroxylating ferredoxin subunit